MAIYHQGRKVKEVWHQGRKVKEVWHMGRKVFSSGPDIVVLTGTKYGEARDQLGAALTARGLDYTTVTQIPFILDTTAVTEMAYMFSGCSSLTSVPPMDTTAVTDMSGMFSGCSSLTSVPPMDTTAVTEMAFMFSGCSSLTSVPPMHTTAVTNMSGMFRGCSSLTSVPPMDTRNVTSMNSMFMGCSSLKDGNIKLIRNNSTKPRYRIDMIAGSGLTREPFYLPHGTPIN